MYCLRQRICVILDGEMRQNIITPPARMGGRLKTPTITIYIQTVHGNVYRSIRRSNMSDAKLSDFKRKFVYVNTSPEKIVSAKKGALFFRKGTAFYFNASGAIDGKWEPLKYRTVVLPAPSEDALITYENQSELWLKNSDGFLDEYRRLLPKTDWKFLVYNTDVFSQIASFQLHWTFPPPTGSSDAIGMDGDRSYDENYFYAKYSGSWYRTPIAIFDADAGSLGDSWWESHLPFVDFPPINPPPSTSSATSGFVGQQSYDDSWFYIKPKSKKWKRCSLKIFDPSKMTTF